MATGEKRMVEKIRVVEEKYTEEKVILELDKDESFVLYLLLNRVGGSRSGPRAQIDSIRGALAKCGIQWDYSMSKADAKVSGYPILPDTF